MSYSHCPAACRKKAGLTQAAALNIDCLIPMAQLDESEISGLNGRNVRHWMDLLCLISCSLRICPGQRCSSRVCE